MYSAREKVYWFAVASRSAVLCLSALSDTLFEDHKAEDVFISSIHDGASRARTNHLNGKQIMFDSIVRSCFGGLVRWDGHYFLHISKYGYTKENMLAFFPFFPFLVRTLSLVLNYFLDSFTTYESLLILSSVIVNFLLFVKSALVLYDLNCAVLNDKNIAYKAAILYCVNPASIFFTAPYSETSYAFLTFTAMLNCVKSNIVVSSITNGLSSCTRSNGLLNVGFVIHKLLTNTYCYLTHKKNALIRTTVFINSMLSIFGCIIISFAPFILFQFYSYMTYCVNSIYKNERVWCNKTIPLAYSYVQDHYWNVGFLRYYEFKQIPNFMLALPLIYIILKNTFIELKNGKDLRCRIKVLFTSINGEQRLVFIIHAASLTIFCLFCVHVQITTRMLCSSSPVLYWFAAQSFKTNFDKKFDDSAVRLKGKLLARDKRKGGADKPMDLYYDVDSRVNMRSRFKVFLFDDSYNVETGHTQRLFFKFYFIGYFAIGTIMFSNFYPFT